MCFSHRFLAAFGLLTLTAASIGGCSTAMYVQDSYEPTSRDHVAGVDPVAYDVLVASATYRPTTGLALGAGDHFGNLVHEDYVVQVRAQRGYDPQEYATVSGSGRMTD